MTLYERLGSTPGIEALVQTIAEAHLANPVIAARYHAMAEDPEHMAKVAGRLCEFLEAGTGGPAEYTGEAMPEVHRGMNVSAEEYLAAVDDIMGALEEHGRDEQTKKDVLAIVYSLKNDIVRR